MNARAPGLRAATGPRPAAAERLIVLDASGHPTLSPLHTLASHLEPGDLLILNDAGTLPASLSAVTDTGARLEVRLAAVHGAHAIAALLGEGDWRMATERRPPPPGLSVGQTLRVAGLEATVLHHGERQAALRFEVAGPALLDALLRHGRPVQYSYHRSDLPLSAFQTPFAGVPVAAEMPSAGRPLRASVLRSLRQRGMELATLTHAAGLSSIDGGAVDATLPWPERTWLPARTVHAIAKTRGRVIAVGTTVVRALEGVHARAGTLVAGVHDVDLVLGPRSRPVVVDGLFTNLHEPGESHFELLQAFARREALLVANALAEASGLVAHEFGDSLLILP